MGACPERGARREFRSSAALLRGKGRVLRTIAEARERLAIASCHLADLLAWSPVANHPATPGLERLAVEAVDLAADVLLGVALLIGRETAAANERDAA